MSTNIPDTGATLAQLLDTATRAHRAIHGADALGSLALRSAFDAGDALIAAKARVDRGQWADTLAQTGIPPSTARLYMQLARNRERILAAGCTSIREARRLLTDRKPPRKRAATRASTAAPADDRYEEGYMDGYRAGRADGAREAGAGRRNGRPPQLAERDIKWLIKRAHPDHNAERDSLKANRATAWLNDLLDRARGAS
jgi:hypothetical protein